MTNREPLAPAAVMTAERTAQLRTFIVSEAARPRRRFGRAFILGAFAAALVLLLGVGTATAWVFAGRPDQADQGYCSPTVDADRSVWGQYGVMQASAAGQPGAVLAQQGLEACAAMWSAGLVRAPGTPDQSGTSYPVPSLAACVIDGNLVVFPSDKGVCARLGVATASD